MPDKDFEQQLRDGLHDWQMAPPPPVRDAVLKAVRRRRRRRGLLWIPLGVVLLGAALGGYYAFRRHPSVTVTPVGAPVARRAASVSPTAPPAAVPAVRGATPAREAITLRKTGADRPAVPAAIEVTKSATTKAATSAAAPPAPDLLPSNAPVALAPMPWSPAALTHLPLEISGAISGGDVKNTGGAKNSVKHGAKNMGGAKPAAWSFRVYAAGGASGQGPFLSFGAPAQSQHVNFMDAGATGNNAGVPVTGGSGATASTGMDTLAGRSAGFGWTVGVSASRLLASRFRAEAGLAFTQAETRIGPVNGYGPYLGYTATNQYNYGAPPYTTRLTYINSYRLLSLPLDVSWSVAPRTRAQPSVYLGVTPAWLFSGDALMYNPSYSGYEVAKSLYRHLQLSGEVGFRATILRFKGGDVGAGPFLEYGFSNLQKLTPVRDHLNYTGIRLDLSLAGKTSKKAP